ncbi:MAG: aminotransferase class V-fold PLP-dependent enzyme [Pseudomonadota bacterium]
MTMADSSTEPDWAAIRSQFPFLETSAYFDIGRKAALPSAAKAAADAWFEDVYGTGGANAFSMDGQEQTRQVVSDTFGAPRDNIALIKNTSEGIGAIACGFPFEPGDNVIISEHEHENNTFQWLHARERGIDVRYAKPDADGCVRPDAYVDLIDNRTRIIGVAWVAYGNGYRADMVSLSNLCRAHGIKLVVDAIQAIGVIDQRVDALGADAVVSGGHKAQFSVTGAGFMYLTQEMIELVRPPIAAKYSFESIDRHVPDPVLRSDARRFEYGNPNFLGLAIQRASADFVRRIGLANIEARVRALTTTLIDALEKQQFKVLTPRPWHERAGIVAFEVPGDAAKLEMKLREDGIRTAHKDGHMRCAVHFYNSYDDIDRLMAGLSRYAHHD